jgi:hypothetical protein
MRVWWMFLRGERRNIGRESCTSAILYTPKIPHEITRDRTGISVMKGGN